MAEKIEPEKQLGIVKKHLRRYPDFPKPGIVFVDVFSILLHPEAFQALNKLLIESVRKFKNIEAIAALDSRGFLFGPTLALEMNLPFIPIRKKGKLPGPVTDVAFALEYGTDVFEIQTDSVQPNQKVLLVDDLLATGGSLAASCQLISKLGAQVVQCLVVMELPALKGRNKIPAPVHSLIQETDI